MEIKTNDKMNKDVKDLLQFRGDNISMYSLTRICELESQVENLTKENEKLKEKAWMYDSLNK